MAFLPTSARGNYAIELNGSVAGWVNSVEFPTFKLDPVDSQTGVAVGTATSGGKYSCKRSGWLRCYAVVRLGTGSLAKAAAGAWQR